MLPQKEIAFLNETIATAICHVDEGRVASGYDLLLSGLRRARVRRARGEPGGPELVKLWCRACDIYCASYGVSMELE